MSDEEAASLRPLQPSSESVGIVPHEADLESQEASQAALDTPARSDEEVIAEQILSGEILTAFRTNPWAASKVIAEHVCSSDPRWAAIAPTLPLTLASLLEEQQLQTVEEHAPTEPARALEQDPLVRLYLAKTLTWLSHDPRVKSEALDIVLSEAPALGDDGCDAVRHALSFFEPLEVMPNLIRFLGAASDRGRAAWEVLFASIRHLIDDRFGAYENRPADAERCRGEMRSLLADLLTPDERLDEWVEERVVGIVRTRATPLGGGLKPVVEKLGAASEAASDCRPYATRSRSAYVTDPLNLGGRTRVISTVNHYFDSRWPALELG